MRLVQGLAPNLDLSIAEHLRGPLDALSDNRVRWLHFMAPPGAGKTVFIEGAIQDRIVNRPSNILLIGQTDEGAELWAETRLHPSFKKSPWMKPFLPEDRHKNRKSTVIFPHGIFLDICGPSMSNLQEKSMPMVIIDEAWRMDRFPGRIAESKARTHDKWNEKMVLVGQGGETHQDATQDDSENELYIEWRKTDQREFSFLCPSCQTRQPYHWAQLKWDRVDKPNGEIDWKATGPSLRYECINPECGEKFPDDSLTRRKLATSGVYVPTNPDALPGHIGFHCNALSVWRIAWLKLAMQWEDAMKAKAKGDFSLMQVFVQKRLAEFWKPGKHVEETDLMPGGYLIADYAEGQLIDNEARRFLTVDVQQNSVWFVIRAWTSTGDSKQLLCGQLHTFEEIEEKRRQYKVQACNVLVDAQYRTDYVYQQCGKFGWTAFHGTAQESYPISTPSGLVRMPYSSPQRGQSGSGQKAYFINFCSNPIKDVLAEIRAGRLGSWTQPDDTIPDFKKHLEAEVKRSVQSGRDNKEVKLWVRLGKRDNHLLDCEMAQVGMAMVRGYVQLPEHQPAA